MEQYEKVQHSGKIDLTGNGTNPNQNDRTPLSSYVKFVIEAHGGLARWRAFNKVSANVVSGGFLWKLRGIAIDDAPRRVTSELRRQ